MTRRSPYVVELSVRDRAVLEARARAYTAAYHEVVRAKIVLLAADGLDNTVIAARLDVRDEKTSIQARCRCHPTLPTGKARMMRVEHEYQRKGALAYLAAYDGHHARVIGRMEPTTGIEPFGRLVEQVMTTEPYASAERVFWVVDNGSSHRGRASIDRMTAAWPTAHLVHLPVHASWLDQIEIFYSILQRKVLTPNDLTDLDALAERCWPSRIATTPPPHRSTGDSPAPTSTGSSTASPHTTPRQSRPWPRKQATAYFRRGPLSPGKGPPHGFDGELLEIKVDTPNV